MPTVLIITANGCPDCGRIKSLIHDAAEQAGQLITWKELDADSEEAVEKALLYGLTTVPSFVIRNKVFNTTTPSVDEIIGAFRSKIV